jgi:hypothetical protein
VPGALLTQDQVVDTLSPGAGRQLVPVGLKPEQTPASGIRPGYKVLLVAIAASSASDADLAPPTTTPAVVAAVSEPGSGGIVVIDVEVADSDGPNIAALAASDRLSVVVTSRG